MAKNRRWVRGLLKIRIGGLAGSTRPRYLAPARLFLLDVLFLLLLCRHVSSHCKIAHCNSEYLAAKRNMSVTYCGALRSYSVCTHWASLACRGNLEYHLTVYVIADLMAQSGCTERDPPPATPLPTPTRHHQGLDSLDGCDYEKHLAQERGQSPVYQHCTAFGNPHVRTFSDEFHTCRVEGAWPLLDNHYLFVQATSSPLAQGFSATAIRTLTIIFKNMEQCTDERVYQAERDHLPAAFVGGSVHGGERPGGSSLTIEERVPGQHVEIRATYIGTTIAVRQVGRWLSFSIQAPRAVIGSFAVERDLQLCMWGCPPSQRISRSNSHGEDSFLAMARQLCKECLPVEDSYFQACTFDVATSGDALASLAAQQALEDAQRFHPDRRKLHIFQTAPTSASSSSSSCSSSASSSSSRPFPLFCCPFRLPWQL